MPPSPDVLVVGAGVIGLSLALEVAWRGMQVLVLDRAQPMAQASSAAAGMLAAEDPFNPNDLRPLSRLSASLYPEFLQKIEELSGQSVPLQTRHTVQTFPGGTVGEIEESSLDPRQLAPALLAAAVRAGVQIVSPRLVDLSLPRGDAAAERFMDRAGTIVYATGAWAAQGLPVTPCKGQMLRVRIPPGLTLDRVHRAEHIYVVPRTSGPQAGTALIGATVEDAGFDTTVQPTVLAHLRSLAANLVPAIADDLTAPPLEAWAGLRPSTPDGLPILGELQPAPGRPSQRRFVATGHFRNGILLAPATALVTAELIERRSPSVRLEAFSPARFTAAAERT